MKPKKNLTNQVHELIEKRWSPRSFNGEPVAESDLMSLFEAARWSPSSYNEQPWHFFITRKNEDASYNQLFECINQSNKDWAMRAPVLVLGMYRVRSEHTGELNGKAQYDLGGAVANLTLEATSRGLFVHQIGGFNVKKTIETFQIPEEYQPFIVLAIGYNGASDILPDALKWKEETPQIRKNLSDIISKGIFNFK